MKKYVSFLFCLSFSLCGISQIALSGNITDTTNKPIPSVSITLQKTNTNLIVAFAISNATGGYNLQYNGAFVKDSFTLKANTMGFKAVVQQINTATQIINFSMLPFATILPNVTVKNPKPFLKV